MSPPATSTPGYLPTIVAFFSLLGRVSPAKPDDLIEAVVTRLQLGLVTPRLVNWIGTGHASKNIRPPYVIVGELSEEADYQQIDGSTPVPYDEMGTLPVLCVATTERACATLSRQTSAALGDAGLSFSDGNLLLIRRTARGAPVFDPSPGPGGEGCWVAHLVFATITSKTL